MMRTPFRGQIKHHPLFVRDVRRMPWGESEDLLKRSSLRLFLAVQAVSVGVWLLVAGLMYLALADYDRNLYRFATSVVLQADLLIMVATILAGLVLDVMSMRAALNSISGEVLAGRWDLIRLTALHENGVVRAKHSIAQLHTWRPTLIMVAVRFAMIWIYVLAYFFAPGILLRDAAQMTSRLSMFVYAPVESLLVLLISAFTAAIYILEPLWRMKAMTALGLTISSYILNGPLAMLASMGAIFAVWLAQLIIFASLTVVFGVFAPLFFFSSTVTFLYVYSLGVSLINGLTIYGFYILLQEWSLRRVMRRIARDK